MVAVRRYEKLTERAQKALEFAQEEATQLNHNYIGTEHILLGILRDPDCVGARILLDLGQDLSGIRSAVEFIVSRHADPTSFGLGLTPKSKKVIELAFDEARRINDRHVGTEHLLIGIMREAEGVSAGVLESLRVTLEDVRSANSRIKAVASVPVVQKTEAVRTRPRVSDEELSLLIKKIEQMTGSLKEAHTLLLQLQVEREAQKPQEPSSQT